MNKIEFFKKLLPGLLPLLVFIAADEIWGTKIGLIVAVGFGIVEFVFIYIKQKIIDKFIIVDTLLLVMLGGISIVFDNDIFFKLKPAFIEAIFCVVLGVSVYSPKNIMLMMSKRYMRGVEMTKEQEQKMTQSVKVMFYLFTLHTILIVYSAYFMSKESWAFISGALLYIIAGVYFVFELLKNRFKQKQVDLSLMYPIVNKKGEVKGIAPQYQFEQDKSLNHPALSLYFINNKKQLFLSKKDMNNTVDNIYDSSIRENLKPKEQIEDSIANNLPNELKTSNLKISHLFNYLNTISTTNRLVYTFVSPVNDLDKTNRIQGKYWSRTEIKKNIGKHVFSQDFEIEFPLLEKALFK